MIDVKLIRENPDVVKENIKKKFQDPAVVDQFLDVDEQWRNSKKEIDGLRSMRNKLSQDVNKLKKEGSDASKILEEVKGIPGRIKKNEEVMKELEMRRMELLLQIPNIMDESVPQGKDESENKELRKWGTVDHKDFKVLNHVEILEKLNLVEFDKSADMSGNGFYILKGDLALLNQSLIKFAVDFMAEKGYMYIEPPLMLKTNILAAATDMETLKNTIYDVKDEDLSLIGTSEYSILAMHMNETIEEKDLPKKYFAYTMCFRKEIGSHGINEKGLWRTHQFNKVEQFVFAKPEESQKYYDEMLANTEELFMKLELPHRVLEMCSGDLAVWKSKSCDVEVWRPTTNDYGEVASLSNCTDFQARRLNIKCHDGHGNYRNLHTLNNTVVATINRQMVQ